MPNFPLERLRKRSDFLAVTRRGARDITPGFIVQCYQRAPEGPVRYGVTATRKIGGAVERNRAKRRLRVLLRLVLPQRSRPGADYVLIARQAILKRDFALMQKELIQALEHLQGSRAIPPRGLPKDKA